VRKIVRLCNCEWVRLCKCECIRLCNCEGERVCCEVKVNVQVILPALY